VVLVFFFYCPVVLAVSVVAVVVALAVGPAEADILVRCADSAVDKDAVVVDGLGRELV
jgi:hypothetical protein